MNLINKRTQKVIITHRGTNASIEQKLREHCLAANYPIPDWKILRRLEHSKKAVWVCEGKPTLWNKLWSGMVGMRGEAYLYFEINKALIKTPDGLLKRWFGKSQRVIEQDVQIPDNVVCKLYRKRRYGK